MGDKKTFIEFMNEEKFVNRWFVLKVAIGGAFLGALGAICFVITGFIHI